jgi:hypothetical protein
MNILPRRPTPDLAEQIRIALAEAARTQQMIELAKAKWTSGRLTIVRN